jgi:alanine racemase
MRHSSFLEINFKLLAENMEKIRRLSGKALVLPMVKADAYGNGLIPVTQFLVQEEKIKKIGVATLGEALKLTKECPDLDTEYIVFSDTEIADSTNRQAYQDYNITPVIHQPEDLNHFLSDSKMKDVPLIVKVNTGMNRLGFTLNELEACMPRLKTRGIKHLMTHFAYSYVPQKSGDKTTRQLEEFSKVKKLLADGGVAVEETSVSNSGAIEQKIGIDETYVRPGLMMYGPYSVEPRLWDGHQISRLVTKVIKTFPVKKGTPVGYGINVAGEDGFVAVLPVGYGDGLPTFASGVKLTVNGFPCSIFARVNMDMCFLMFSPDVAGKIKTGDVVEIWNNDNRAISDIAAQMKTIPYAIMCGITGRIPRIYKIK